MPKEAKAAYLNHNCVVDQVQLVASSLISTGDRIAAKCESPAPGGIYWFAYNITKEDETVKMVLSLLSTARVAGRSVLVSYESSDLSGDRWGCQSNDCRIIKKLEMR